MDFLSAIVGPVVESLLVPVKKHMGYLFSSTKHVRNMSTRMKQLHDKSIDVKKHMERNNISNLEIPTGVPDWLEEVEKIKEDAERNSSNVNGCCNLKMRYRAGRKAFKTTQQIEDLIKENNETIWSDAQKPIGKVSFKMASTSDGDAQDYFKSREKIFKEALGLLQQDQKAQVIALCGMGGVGKTTMMEQLKKAVEDKKMFDWVVKEVSGQKINIFSIQQTMADYLGHHLTEKSITARADRLCKAFQKMSQESKNKVLVVLDDVWEKIELKDIGLSPLPKGFKLLLTSRNEEVCKQIAVEANSDFRVVRVDVMEEFEAINFFCQISVVSNPELKDIGDEIVRRCGFLPLAIKLIATNLKSREKSVWRDTLRCLKENDLDDKVQRIIEISYSFIAEEDAKAVFLLCGLFPDDFNIPIEDLTRYAWGLKLFKKVRTLGDARDRTKACVLNLKSTSLLLDSDLPGCVKMHDLVLAFVVAEVSKGDHPWFINHGDVSNWNRAEMSESCGRISLTCMGMSEFPRDFNYRNVSLLRLMNGDESLKFPEDLYEKMENLQVMACEKLHYPLLPRWLQCSTKLQTLCLHKCSLMCDGSPIDCSPIGDYLLNLEVLSFAHSGIRYLPSAIGNLVKLRLLDLTGCIDLYIEEGVLKKLVNLEELCMTVANKKGVKFTDTNFKELEERSKNLSTLEVEFFENNPQSKNMSYNKLERFKISMGCFLYSYMQSSENWLMLVANKDELLESGMNELFSKTGRLHLKVGGMKNLEEVLPKSVPQHSFYSLRFLRVSDCADLRYLFTVPVANGLVTLEHLIIRDCPVMESLVYIENGEEGIIRFQKLKDLWLENLQLLVGLSNTNHVIDLPQLEELVLEDLPNFTSIYPEYKSTTSVKSSSSPAIKPFFNKEVIIPKLATLQIIEMEASKNIWPCGSSEEVDACLLRYIRVDTCHNLVNMFPSNPMPLLHHLESIVVDCCSSIETLFDIDNLQEVLQKSIPRHSLYNLRDLYVSNCNKLRYLFTVQVASGLGKLEYLRVENCPVMEALVYSENCEEEYIRFEELKELSLDNLSMLAGFSNTNNVIDLPQLEELHLKDLPKLTRIYQECKSTSVMSSSSPAIKPLFNKKDMMPMLKNLEIIKMEALKNIWPCGRSEEVDAILLQRIWVEDCDNLLNMFPSNLSPLLHHLKSIIVGRCGSIEVLVYSENGEEGFIRFQELNFLSLDKLPMFVGFSNTNDVIDLPQLEDLYLEDLPKLTSIFPEYTATSVMSNSSSAIKPLFNKKVMIPRLKTLDIEEMQELKYIWSCGGDEEAHACLLQHITVRKCHNLVNVLPSNPMPLLHHLETIDVVSCDSIEVLLDIDVECLDEIKDSDIKLRSISVAFSGKLREVWRLKGIINPDLIICGFQGVERIKISNCKSFQYMFTPTTARFCLEALQSITRSEEENDEPGSDYEESDEEENNDRLKGTKK